LALHLRQDALTLLGTPWRIRMRRLLLATLAVGIVGAAAAPAMAKPDVPVGVGGNGNGGVCVYAFHWVPQCVDTGQVGTKAGAPRR
jgi:hypothetical protein